MKTLEALISRSDFDEKSKGTARTSRQKMRVGQIIQNGCLPYFAHVDGVSGVNPSASVSVDSSMDHSHHFATPEQREAAANEHSLVLDDDDDN